MKRFSLIIYFLSALLLSGCVKDLLTSKSNIRDFYTLSAVNNVSPSMSPLKVGLLVQRPTAGPGLGGEKIALKTQAYKMDFYANARWIAELPRIVQARLIDSFENTGKLPRVSNANSDMKADYLLAIELRSFQAEYLTPDGAPDVNVKIAFKLLTAHERQVVTTGVFEMRITASENTLDSIMATFDQAFQGVEHEIVNAVLKQLHHRAK